ncbi:aldo/keto reductase [Curtanaerobium respiraculi]|uniref:aldo/keto reductase n=1 Tax=Curtanaerobium respiraculi TaxID=2949669 RepID=UPI0024B34BC5|nr:aldo/keto reductase [Curtanaerobium respiraculi]
MKETKLPKIALGAWAWGDDGTFGTKLDNETLRDVFDTAMDAGLNLWDTAYAYGMGTSEKALGKLLAARPRESYLVSDKLTPQCMDASAANPVADMYGMQLGLLGVESMDIYWIHNPFGAPSWTTKLAEYLEGMDNPPVIGVSNHSLAEIKQADEILKQHGLKLGAVQNHFSLLERSSESGGILDWCKESGVAFWAYMVLEQGALSGKYDAEHPMPAGSDRAAVYNPVLGEIGKLNSVLAEVAQAHGVSAAQIPVAWAIAKETVPIVGVTKKSHVEDAARAAAVELSSDEMAKIEQTAGSLDLNLVRYWEKRMD